MLLYDSLIASQYPCVDYPTDQLSLSSSQSGVKPGKNNLFISANKNFFGTKIIMWVTPCPLSLVISIASFFIFIKHCGNLGGYFSFNLKKMTPVSVLWPPLSRVKVLIYDSSSDCWPSGLLSANHKLSSLHQTSLFAPPPPHTLRDSESKIWVGRQGKWIFSVK